MFSNRLMGTLGGGIAVDLGTVNTLVAIRGQGIVLREPTVVTVRAGNKQEVLSVGQEAIQLLGRTPGSVNVCYPMREGVICDGPLCEAMLKHYIRRAWGRKIGPLGVRLMLCLPLCITDIERRAMVDAAKAAGAREVLLMEEPVAAALGAGVSPMDPMGNMVVDIGGGTTDAAVLALGGIAAHRSIRVGGTHIDEAIAAYIREEYELTIGGRTAEQLKLALGRAQVGGIEHCEVRGRNLKTGLPASVVVGQREIGHAIVEPLRKIAQAVRETLAETPPELAGDILERGLILTGGGALLSGMGAMLARDTGLSVRVAEDPLDCVVLGALKGLDLRDDVPEGLYSDMTVEA